MGVKTDNHNLEAKLELRRYFLRGYHLSEPPNVFDACAGDGVIWRKLREEFAIGPYLAADRKAGAGVQINDSARLLGCEGWTFDVIDVDTYGVPWKHWFALLHNGIKAMTVFLTIGRVTVGGISPQADGDTLRVLGLAPIIAKIKASGWKMPQSLTGLVRDKVGFDVCMNEAERAGFKFVELIEAENPGGHARYIGARLEPLRGGGA